MKPTQLCPSELPTDADPRLIERITRWVIVDSSGCWIWTGGTRLHGGHMQIRMGRNGDRKKQLAHRVVYEAFVGPIPAGLVIDHLCNIPACCNPLHLEPVTQRDNVRRGHARRSERFDAMQQELNRWRERALAAEAEIGRNGTA